MKAISRGMVIPKRIKSMAMRLMDGERIRRPITAPTAVQNNQIPKAKGKSVRFHRRRRSVPEAGQPVPEWKLIQW